jgi:hypothetical protein
MEIAGPGIVRLAPASVNRVARRSEARVSRSCLHAARS